MRYIGLMKDTEVNNCIIFGYGSVNYLIMNTPYLNTVKAPELVMFYHLALLTLGGGIIENLR